MPPTLAATAAMLLGLGVAFRLHFQRASLPGVAALGPLGDIARSGAVDRFWRNLYIGGLRATARSVAWFDRYIIDALINAVGVGTLEGARHLRTMQTGRGGDYVFLVLMGLMVVMTWSVVFV